MPVISTVVSEVSVKMPEPRPLKGVDLEAKAAGKALRTIIRPRMLIVRNLIASSRTRKFLYKGSR